MAALVTKPFGRSHTLDLLRGLAMAPMLEEVIDPDTIRRLPASYETAQAGQYRRGSVESIKSRTK
jgi:hypothetical protein